MTAVVRVLAPVVRFVAADDAYGAGGEYFLGVVSGRAPWFAYDRHGFPDDLGDLCG
jgi:hypothetical protein